MSSKWVRGLIPVAILAVSATGAAALIASKEPPEKQEVEKKAMLVATTDVAMQDLNFIVKSQGSVMPREQTLLSAEVSGKIVAIADAFIEGGMFAKGDVLVTLEQADFITDLKSAEAELAQARAALDEEKARGRVAAEEWRQVKNSVAPELGLRKPQLARELANVRAAEAQVERAKRNLQRTEIRAPYAGIVKERVVGLGQYVAPGTQLATLFSTDVAEVRLPLSDNDLAFLELNDTIQADVTLVARVAGKLVQWQGTLVRNEGVLDEQSRVIYAIAQVDDPYLRESNHHSIPLKFGRFVRAQITGNRGEDLVVLPRNALRLDSTVMVVDNDNRLRIRSVDVQRSDERSVYISGGLQQGEKVAVSAIPNPVDGMEVRLPDSAKQGDVLAQGGAE